MRIRKWIARIIVFIACIMIVAAAVVYFASSRIINRTYDVPLDPIAARSDSASIARGRLLARTRGCMSCHGEDGGGKLFVDEPFVSRIIAPDLTHEVEEYNDAELARIIRHGITPNGTSIIAMPSLMFYHLSDTDVGSIIAYLRSLPKAHGPDEEVTLRLLSRIAFVTGDSKPQAEQINHDQPRIQATTAATGVFGKYVAVTSCSECHGRDLDGSTDGDTIIPDLTVVQAYPDSAFFKLMREGVALGNREVGVMTDVARSRFTYFSDEEIDALYVYLSRSGADG